MYKILCKKCGHNNYSASRNGNWICCYCGEELNIEVKEKREIKGKIENPA